MKRLPLALLACAALPAIPTFGQITVSPNVFYDAPDFDVTDGIIDADSVAPGNQVTLRAIIMHANFNGGNWKILMPSGTFSLTVPGNGEDLAFAGDLDINGITMEIVGAPPLPGPPTVIDASPMGDRAFHVLGNAQVTMRTLEISGGGSVGGGGLRQNNGNVTLENVAIDFCSATGAAGANGGGILSFGKLTLNGCTISHNLAQGTGGGIEYQGLDLSISGSTISDNQAGGRGGGINLGVAGAIASIAKSGVLNNVSGAAVGGGSGGGIGNRGNLTLKGCLIEGNRTSSGASGGGVENRGTVAATECTFRNNNAFFGAGIQIAGLASAMLDTCTIDTNFGDTGGGAHNAGTLEVRNSTISNNHALGAPPNNGGGGIYSFGTLYLVNSTISSNIVPVGHGGGLYNANSGSAQISSCTFHANHSTGGDCIASGDLGGAPLVVVRNSLFSNFGAGASSGYLSQVPGVGITSGGYNLFTDQTFFALSASDIAPPPLPGATINPFLGPLQLNGGPTLTHRLFFASRGIGGGDPNGVVDHTGLVLGSDQRFFFRPNVNVADIGAYEAGCDADLYPPGAGDGVVDDFDFVEFAAFYNILLTTGADFDGDGDTDDPDFVVFAAAYDLLICE